MRYSGRPSASSRSRSMAARASRLSRVYTAPTGLFGVLIITALVFGLMAARSARCRAGSWNRCRHLHDGAAGSLDPGAVLGEVRRHYDHLVARLGHSGNG